MTKRQAVVHSHHGVQKRHIGELPGIDWLLSIWKYSVDFGVQSVEIDGVGYQVIPNVTHNL